MIFYPWDVEQSFQTERLTDFSVYSLEMDRTSKDIVELPPLVHTPDGSEPDRQSVKTRLMLLLHAQYPGLDYLMLETVVDHYLDHPDDGPDEVINRGKEGLENYFMSPDSKGPTVRFKHDPYPDLPKEPEADFETAEGLEKLTLEDAKEEPEESSGSSCDVEHSPGSLSGCVSRGTQTCGEGSERSGEQQSQPQREQ